MIKGESNGINSANGWNFYDGVIYGKPNALSQNPSETETGYELLLSTSGDYQMTTLQPKPYIVSTHPGMYYGTLKEAIDSVATNGTATITVTRNVIDASAPEVYAGLIITLNTNGKTITKTTNGIRNTGNFTIEGGGTIETSKASENSFPSLIENTSTLTINNVTINHKGSDTYNWYAIRTFRGIMTINSGAQIITSYWNDTSIINYSRAIMICGNNTTVYMYGGEVSAISSENDMGIEFYTTDDYQTNAAKLYIYGGTINSKGHGIYVWQDPAHNITQATVDMRGGIINAGDNGLICSSNSEILIKSGTIIGKKHYGVAMMNNMGTLTIGTPGGTPSTSVPEIQGKTYGIEGNFNFYDGIIKGQIYALVNDPTEVEEGYIVKIERPGLYQTATLEKGAYTVSTQPNKTYGTLKSAVDAVAAGETATITVTKDVTDNVQAIVPEGKNIKLDLNGKTITVDKLNEKKFIVNNGTFEIIDSGTSGEIVMNVAYQ